MENLTEFCDLVIEARTLERKGDRYAAILAWETAYSKLQGKKGTLSEALLQKIENLRRL